MDRGVGVLAIADGMGGHPSGNLASRQAIQEAFNHIRGVRPIHCALREAILLSHAAVSEHSDNRGAHSRLQVASETSCTSRTWGTPGCMWTYEWSPRPRFRRNSARSWEAMPPRSNSTPFPSGKALDSHDNRWNHDTLDVLMKCRDHHEHPGNAEEIARLCQKQSGTVLRQLALAAQVIC